MKYISQSRTMNASTTGNVFITVSSWKKMMQRVRQRRFVRQLKRAFQTVQKKNAAVFLQMVYDMNGETTVYQYLGNVDHKDIDTALWGMLKALNKVHGIRNVEIN